MSNRDLAAKYGAKKNTKRLITAAIRAEIPGGNELIEAREELLADPLLLVTPAGQLAERAFARILDAMAAEIRRRYGLGQREEG